MSETPARDSTALRTTPPPEPSSPDATNPNNGNPTSSEQDHQQPTVTDTTTHEPCATTAVHTEQSGTTELEKNVTISENCVDDNTENPASVSQLANQSSLTSSSFGGKPPIAPSPIGPPSTSSRNGSFSSLNCVDRLLQKNPKLFSAYSAPLKAEAVEDMETLADLLFSPANAALLSRIVPLGGHQVTLRRLILQQSPEICRSYMSQRENSCQSPYGDNFTDEDDDVASAHSGFSITSYQTAVGTPLPRTDVVGKPLPKVISLVDTTALEFQRAHSASVGHTPGQEGTPTKPTGRNADPSPQRSLPPKRTTAGTLPNFHHQQQDQQQQPKEHNKDEPPASTKTDTTEAKSESRYLLAARHHQSGTSNNSSSSTKPNPGIRTPRNNEFMSSSNSLADPRHNNQSEINVKVVVVGASGSGKSSLIRRIVNNAFDPTPKTTIGVDFSQKRYIAGERLVTLRFWDIQGQESRPVLSHTFLYGAAAAIICYDANDPNSLRMASLWKDELESKADAGMSINSYRTFDDRPSTRASIASSYAGSPPGAQRNRGGGQPQRGGNSHHHHRDPSGDEDEPKHMPCYLVATKCDLMKVSPNHRNSGNSSGGRSGGSVGVSPRVDGVTLPRTSDDGAALARSLSCLSHHFTSSKSGENCRQVAEHLVMLGLDCGSNSFAGSTCTAGTVAARSVAGGGGRDAAPVRIRGADEPDDEHEKLGLLDRVKKFLSKKDNNKQHRDEQRQSPSPLRRSYRGQQQDEKKCFLS